MISIDVLIPHYNDLRGLDLSLRSIAGQTWKGGIRVVIVDDGSDNDVRIKVRRLASRCGLYVDVLENDVNRGRPYTRNVLLRSIKSQYVGWLDAGDEWYPQKLERQFAKIRDLELSGVAQPYWVTCNYDWVWIGQDPKCKLQKIGGDQVKELLIGSRLRAYLWTVVGPASSFTDVGWFDERLPRMQDLDFFIRFKLQGGQIYNATKAEPLCAYHKSDEGRDALEISRCNLIVFEKHRPLFAGYGENFLQMRLFRMDMLAWRFAQNNRDSKLARHFMFKSAFRRPIAFLKHVWKRRGLRA